MSSSPRCARTCGWTNGSCRATSRSLAFSTAAWTRRSRGLPPPTGAFTYSCCGPSRWPRSYPPASEEETVAADRLRVLLDADLTSWDAWNQFAREFAEAAGARVVEIDDGGITGRGFHDHCRRLNKPVLQSPKRHRASLPPGLRTRSIRDPTPHLVLVTGDPRRRRPPRRARAARDRREAGRDRLPSRAAQRRGDVGPGRGPAPRHDHGPDRIYAVAASTIATSCSVVPPLTPTPAITWPSLVTGTPPPIAEYRPPETASRG